MKNFKIGKKLLVTFGCIVVLLLVVVIVSITSLSGNGDRFTNFHDNGFYITNRVMEIRRSIQASAKNIGYSMMTGDEALTQQYIQSSKDETETMSGGVDYMRNNFRGDQSLVDGFENSMQEIQEARDKVYELALNNKNDEAGELYFDEVMPGYLKANDYLNQIYDVATDNAENNYDEAGKAEKSTLILLIVLSATALCVTVALALYITRSLTRPIREIEQAATEMVKGHLDVSVSYESKDELGVLSEKIRTLTETLRTIISDSGELLGELAEGNFDIHTKAEQYYVGDFQKLLLSIRKIRVGLSETLSQINESAEQVNVGAEQVSGGAQTLSQGATEQASSIEELAATINEISDQVNKNADSAREANDKAGSVGAEAARSNDRMQNMLAAISEISESSNEISKIIKTIEDIAFQTNILALNAAVEAARAGAAGKGFAVVADEVRNLASKSAEASSNTAALIENSLHSVENGARIADETAGSLASVIEGVKEVTETIGGISEASVEQAQSIAQVTQGVDQISSVVQTNSATAEESAAASEELSGQAQVLKGLVSKFRLADSAAVKNGAAGGQTYAAKRPVALDPPAGTGAPVRPVSAVRPDGNHDKY